MSREPPECRAAGDLPLWVKETLDLCVFIVESKDRSAESLLPALPSDWREAIEATSLPLVSGLCELILLWTRHQKPPAIAGPPHYNRPGRYLSGNEVATAFDKVVSLRRLLEYDGLHFNYHPNLTSRQKDEASDYSYLRWTPTGVRG